MNVLENNLTLCYNVGMSESISEYYDRVLLGIKTATQQYFEDLDEKGPENSPTIVFRKQETISDHDYQEYMQSIDSSVESYQTVVILNDRVVVREDDLPNR